MMLIEFSSRGKPVSVVARIFFQKFKLSCSAFALSRSARRERKNENENVWKSSDEFSDEFSTDTLADARSISTFPSETRM